MKKEVWLRMAMEIADCRLEKDWANFFKVFFIPFGKNPLELFMVCSPFGKVTLYLPLNCKEFPARRKAFSFNFLTVLAKKKTPFKLSKTKTKNKQKQINESSFC